MTISAREESVSLKVVITDYYYPTLIEEQRVFANTGIEIVDGNGRCTGEDDILALARDADALIVQFVRISRRVIEGLTRCRVIVRYAIGLDNIDIPAATAKRIMVANVPDYCISEVSDHALALILALVRKVKLMDAEVRQGIWSYRRAVPVRRLSEMSLGLIGFGNIARQLARKAHALGFGRVLAHDPYVRPDAGMPEVSLVPLEELLRESDVLSVHAPATGETRHLLDRERLALLKPGAFLVNTSRGALIAEDALVQALHAGRLAGAAVDVLEDEQRIANHPLLQFDNVILTPHMAWYSTDSIRELQRKVAEQVRDALLHGRPKYWVNPF